MAGRQRLSSAASNPSGAARHVASSTLERACRRLGLAMVFHTRVGVKFYNSLPSSQPLDYPAYGSPVVDALPADLTLGFDGLKDQSTLLGTPLQDSPHTRLMEALLAGEPIESTEYIVRARMGTLDWRRPLYISEGFLASLRTSFREAADRISAGERPLVKTASLGGRTYLLDGKHRAALALAMGADARCQDTTVLFYDSYYAWLERRMQERPDEYSTQLRFCGLARKALSLERTD